MMVMLWWMFPSGGVHSAARGTTSRDGDDQSDG